jgi:hypothetical protein
MFEQDIELDATLMFASTLGEEEFEKIATDIGYSNPLVGIARGFWLLQQPSEYVKAAHQRADEMTAAHKAQVLS